MPHYLETFPESYRNDIRALLDHLGLTVELSYGGPVAEPGHWIAFRTAGKEVLVPSRGQAPEGVDDVSLFIDALIASGFCDVCNDFLDWADEFGLDPGDWKALSEYRELVDVTGAFKLLIGENIYNDLQVRREMGEAMGRAAWSFQQAQKKD